MKKQVLFMCLALFFTKLIAQNTPQEPETSIDSMLIRIDKTSFTSGILYDRVTPLAQLSTFNDVGKNNSNLKHFEQALSELFRASKKQKLTSHKNFRKKYTKKNKLAVVDVGIINISFHELNYNPLNEDRGGLRLIDDVFEQIEGKTPFLSKHALVIAPLKQYMVGQKITYNFKKEFMFEESNAQKIATLTANLGTAKQYVIVRNGKLRNQSIPIKYQEGGYKTLRFTATFSNGTTKTTYGKLHVKIPILEQQSIMADPLVESFTLTSTIPFQGYDETSSIYGELEYRIFYHNNNGNTLRKLLKPIIIIDGFDPEDKRKIQDEDSPKPPEEHNSIEEMMIYYDNGGVKQFIIPKLRNLGYDVVIVNHPTYTRGTKIIDGGADYIERNAMNHVTLYQHLSNTAFQNGSSEKLVIVGPSMGGQISRYALAYMEKNDIPHNTRLWVSIDSPHLGANIPIGMQSMINLLDAFGGSAAAGDFYNNQLKSTASNQQLIEQHVIGQLPDYLNGGSPIHQQYYSNLNSNGLTNSNGYPQNLRKITIINGSLNGVTVGKAGEEDFRIHGFLDQLWWDVKVTEMNTNYLPNTGITKQVARLWRTLKPLRTATYTNNNPNGSMDIVPGGLFNSEDQIHGSIIGESLNISNWNNGVNLGEIFLGFFGIFGDHFESRTNKKVHSFIPTVSSLGFKNPNFNWSQKLDRNLVCSNEIPFDSYFGPDVNERHTSFTEESVNWLLKELAGNPQEPYFPISPSNLVGQTNVCDGQANTFTFNSCKIPGNVSNWQVSSNLQIMSSNGTSITVKPPSDSRSSGWIKADFTNGKSVTKNIWVGRPNSPSSISGPTSVNTGAIVSYKGSSVAGASSYSWRLPYPYTTVGQFDYFGLNWQLQSPGTSTTAMAFTGYAGISGYVQFMGENNCGQGGAKIVYVQHSSSGGGGIPIAPPQDNSTINYFKIYPNPTSNFIYIELIDNSNKIINGSKITGELYDILGSLKKSIKKINNKTKIDIRNLASGIYVLKININGIIESHQVIIK